MRNIIFGIALIAFNASAMNYKDSNGNQYRVVYHMECSGGYQIKNGRSEAVGADATYFYADREYYPNANPAINPAHFSQEQFLSRLQNNRQTVAQIQGLQVFPTPATVAPSKMQQTPPPTRPATRK